MRGEVASAFPSPAPVDPPPRVDQAALLGYLRPKCQALGVLVYAVNGMPDHLHLACTLPTHLSIADFLEAIKDPKHPEHEDMMEWAGRDFDPAAFDVQAVNRAFHGGWGPRRPDA